MKTNVFYTCENGEFSPDQIDAIAQAKRGAIEAPDFDQRSDEVGELDYRGLSPHSPELKYENWCDIFALINGRWYRVDVDRI